jgi:predicted O-methyltransferase YrrM
MMGDPSRAGATAQPVLARGWLTAFSSLSALLAGAPHLATFVPTESSGRPCDARSMTEETDLLARIQRVRDHLVTSGPTDARSDGDFERVALPAALSDAVRDLLVLERPRVVIEIGLAYGSSALAIGEALAPQPDAQHVVIDAFQDHFKNVGWQAIQDAGMDGMSTLLAERSQTALPRMLAQGFVADAAFVDGSHIFHNVFVDLVFLREIVRPGGLAILDDCEWPSVATACTTSNSMWVGVRTPADCHRDCAPLGCLIVESSRSSRTSGPSA